MSVRLYVGNLPKETIEREELQQVFGEASDSLSIKVIKDRKTGNCRGFAFVTVPNDEVADQIIEQYNGQTFKENALKIEKALPRSKNKGENKENNQSDDNKNTSSKSRPNKKKNKESSSSNKRRGKNNKKAKQPAANNNTSNNNTATQPDPRWADELARLKEMLSSVEK